MIPPSDEEAIRKAFFQYVFPIDEPFGAHMSQLRRPLVIDRPHEYPDIPPEFLRDVPFVAVMEVPLVVRDRLVGVAALPVWESGPGLHRAAASAGDGDRAGRRRWRSSTPSCTPAPASWAWPRSGTGWPARSTTRWPRG